MLAPALAVAYGILLCAVLPVLAWQSKRKLDQGLRIPRMALYAEALVLQFLLLGLTWGVARANGLPLVDVPDLSSGDLLLGIAVLGIALGAALVGWRRAGEASKDRLRMMLPATTAERVVWVAVSLTAGISEEVAFRGLLPTLIQRWSGSIVLAVVISVIAFSLSHLLQGWSSALFVGFFAAVFHGVVIVTGSLWIAIAIHVLYDLIAGVMLQRIVADRPSGDGAGASHLLLIQAGGVQRVLARQPAENRRLRGRVARAHGWAARRRLPHCGISFLPEKS
ncbi:MAG TPA: CPBP family intramembrane glutamic endopeptidase [Thermoanaerobaculia bacterium]|nr:CPBP family intramembrane glutamic endopeptidase [Thermoanaerobaculia bacterium]